MTAIGLPSPDTRAGKLAEGTIRWIVALGGAVVVFGCVIWAKGVSPVAASSSSGARSSVCTAGPR